jgi:hypothetical protein
MVRPESSGVVPVSAIDDPRSRYLIINDNALSGLGIIQGDIGIVRVGPVGEGRIAAVRTPDRDILARILKYQAGMIALYPINSHYKPRYYLPSEVVIVGCIVDTHHRNIFFNPSNLLLPRTDAPVFPWTTDDSGRAQDYGMEWLLATGVERRDLQGWNWLTRLVHPEQQAAVTKQWKFALSNGVVYQSKCFVRSALGHYAQVTVMAAPVLSETGGFIEWSGLCQFLL